MSKEQKVTTDLKVPNKDLEALRINFPHCFDKDGNFQLEKFKNNLTEKEINFSSESYGLDWLGKSYARLLASDPATTLLKEDHTHNSKPENANSENLLIKGDNLEVLKHLVNAYYEKVKMIYIDPPYNTGGDGFVYQDDRKFTVSELRNLIGVDEEKAKRILSFTQSKSNSHSAWLTFMYPRLYIAKQLLKDDGVIFISIDDNEVAQLRLLMDEIFGEENFVANVIWERSYSPVNLKKHFSENHDFILCYAKNISLSLNNGLVRNEVANARYSNPDNDKRGVWKSSDLSVGPAIQDNIYEITIPSGRVVLPPSGRSWVLNKLRYQEFLIDNRIWFGAKGDAIPSTKRFLSEVKEGITSMTIWKYSEVGHSQDAAQKLKELFGGLALFDYPKPINLIKRCLELYSEENDLILDFFAGSGTTGDAVMQLNAEDGGNRKFILVQIPEAIDPKKNKEAYDFVLALNEKSSIESSSQKLGFFSMVAEPQSIYRKVPTIFEITKERLLRAANKINSRLDEKTERLKTELPTEETKAEIKNLERLKTQNNFKIIETTPIWEDYDFEATELDSTQTLFDESKLTEDDIKALLTTWKTYDGIALTEELLVISLESLVNDETQHSKPSTQNYKAYYGNGKLYLMDKGFTTNNLKTLLEKIDSDKKFSPTSIIAFGYHFESKNLREISENVKSYANKKNIDIDFITRY